MSKRGTTRELLRELDAWIYSALEPLTNAEMGQARDDLEDLNWTDLAVELEEAA